MSDSLTGAANVATVRYEFSESRCFVEMAIAAIASAQATVPTSRNITKVLRIVAASPFAVCAQTAAHVYSQNPAPTRPSSKSMPKPRRSQHPKPAEAVYTSSAQPRDQINPELLNFAKLP